MRKLSLTLAAAAAALAFAAPASAQYPAQYYGAPYATPQAYGYGQGYGQYNPAQRLQMRIDAVQHFINRLDRADRVPNRAAKELKREARSIERRIRTASAYGLNPYAANDIERRLGRLEQRVSYAMLGRFGRGWDRQGGHNGSPYNGYAQSFDRRDDNRDWYGDRRERDRDDDD